MKFIVVAIGHRMPEWIEAGFREYSARMPREARIELIALKPVARTGAIARVLRDEAQRIRAAVPPHCEKIALDERGALIATAELARRIAVWRDRGRDVAFMIGGADGLDADLKRSADFVWSLSPLTLPHGLARIVLAEQLYRAVSILHNHPYHRP